MNFFQISAYISSLFFLTVALCSTVNFRQDLIYLHSLPGGEQVCCLQFFSIINNTALKSYVNIIPYMFEDMCKVND